MRGEVGRGGKFRSVAMLHCCPRSAPRRYRDAVTDPVRLPFGESPAELLPGDGSALLIPDFLDRAEADRLFDRLSTTLPWEETSLVMFGREVGEPRLSAWIADPGVVYGYSGRNRTVHPWTGDLSELRRRCEDAAHTSFNGVLANLYRHGRDHMGWHADDEASLGPEPVIASVSLGAERRFDLRHRDTGVVVSCTLTHGSLLVMSGLCQERWRHRLPKAPKVTRERINLTFRHVQVPGAPRSRL